MKIIFKVLGLMNMLLIASQFAHATNGWTHERFEVEGFGLSELSASSEVEYRCRLEVSKWERSCKGRFSYNACNNRSCREDAPQWRCIDSGDVFCDR